MNNDNVEFQQQIIIMQATTEVVDSKSGNQIEVVNFLDGVRDFGIHLTVLQGVIKNLHWNLVGNYNAHKLADKFLSELDELFDSFQEELISIQTYKGEECVFACTIQLTDCNVNDFKCDNISHTLINVLKGVREIFNCTQVDTFIKECGIPNGLNNTREEIFSLVNKYFYLFKMSGAIQDEKE